MGKGERLIPLDQETPRGWTNLGEVDTPEGKRQYIIHKRRLKRVERKTLAGDVPTARVAQGRS